MLLYRMLPGIIWACVLLFLVIKLLHLTSIKGPHNAVMFVKSLFFIRDKKGYGYNRSKFYDESDRINNVGYFIIGFLMILRLVIAMAID